MFSSPDVKRDWATIGVPSCFGFDGLCLGVDAQYRSESVDEGEKLIELAPLSIFFSGLAAYKAMKWLGCV